MHGFSRAEGGLCGAVGRPGGGLKWAPIDLWDASAALQSGCGDVVDLIVALCEASPGAQTALRKSGLVDMVVRTSLPSLPMYLVSWFQHLQKMYFV